MRSSHLLCAGAVPARQELCTLLSVVAETEAGRRGGAAPGLVHEALGCLLDAVGVCAMCGRAEAGVVAVLLCTIALVLRRLFDLVDAFVDSLLNSGGARAEVGAVPVLLGAGARLACDVWVDGVLRRRALFGAAAEEAHVDVVREGIRVCVREWCEEDGRCVDFHHSRNAP